MFDIRLPQINGVSEKEQLAQIRSYLYQLAPRLQWALEDINKRQETFSSSSPQAKSQSLSGVSSGASNGDPQATFNSIKALIIKSADIVDAYYEEINKKLEGEYVAVSDFGIYQQNTEAIITESSEKVGVAFTNIQQISTDVNGRLGEIGGELDDLDKGIADAKSEFKAGLEEANKSIESVGDSIKTIKASINAEVVRYDNGTPIYGIKIGQTVEGDNGEEFKAFATFASDRLSFYDQSNTEVAYISNAKLYITEAEVTGTLKLGGYKVETTNGLAFKWEGGVNNG